MMKLFKAETIDARRASVEFARAMWHLRTLFGALLLIFVLLTMVMYRFGGALDTLTHTRAALGDTFYFCAVTALTIGYGDIVPTTGIGRIVAVLLGMQGVLITGLVTSVAVFAIQRAAGRTA